MYKNYGDMLDKVLYTEETINTRPNGAFIQEQIRGLRDDLNRLELDHEEVLFLLYEIVDAEGIEELDEVIIKVKNFVETRPFPSPY